MKYEFDTEFQVRARQINEKIGIAPDESKRLSPRGDVASRRAAAGYVKAVLALEPEAPNVTTTQYEVQREDGQAITVLAYRQAKDVRTANVEPAILYLHGGGMVFGSAELSGPLTKTDVVSTGIAHFSV
jgi:acetyl esterase/lipase